MKKSRLNEHRVICEGHGVNPKNIILRYCVSIFSEKYWDRRPHVKQKIVYSDDLYNLYQDLSGELPSEIRDEMHEEDAMYTPEFKRIVIRWATNRFKRIEKKLSSLPRGSHGIKVSRSMRIDPKKMSQAKRIGHTTLGVHWTYNPEEWDMYPVWGESGQEIIIDAEVSDDHVDWFNTYMSHMDYESGDEEYEIRIKPDSPIHVESIRYDQNSYYDIDGIAFTA